MLKSPETLEYFMRRCLHLAENGIQEAMPNPSVGAVLVYENRIIGEGYTAAYGGPHAEIRALESVRDADKALIPHSTLFVSLEPCSHFGQTPPCSDRIIQSKIRKVVIGLKDPNPLVAGRGIERLKQAGVEVTVGVEEAACRWSLRKFLVSQQMQRPYITLKWAMSSNHKIAYKTGTPVQITSSSTQVLTHKLRAEHQGILVGWKTVFHDRPALNNRLWYGKSPQVILIDLNQKLNDNSHFMAQNDWWRLVSGTPLRANDLLIQDGSLKEILDTLYQKNIHSIFVEGGAYTLQQFINQALWDECYIYQGKLHIDEGMEAPVITHAKLKSDFFIEQDYIRHFVPDKKL